MSKRQPDLILTSMRLSSEEDLPWLESIRLTWGAELHLLNMSSSGLLVESGIRMTLGNRTDFQLADCDHRDFVIRAASFAVMCPQ